MDRIFLSMSVTNRLLLMRDSSGSLLVQQVVEASEPNHASVDISGKPLKRRIQVGTFMWESSGL